MAGLAEEALMYTRDLGIGGEGEVIRAPVAA
ncbi:hypothetical protein XAB3213_2100004 [Xanthomonas citri pv. bilvae]|nr:hypothetical protein XAB3213_2100004 [Xanthomonas citri pv. bilvae]